MKKTVLILTSLVLSSVGAFAQGQIVFNNIQTGVVRAQIFGVDAANPGLSQRGNPANGTPAGATAYGGAALAGTGFSVQVYGGTTSASESSLTPSSVILDFRTGGAAGFINNPNGVVATITGVAEGGMANIQLRAWDNQGGTILTYEQALIRGSSAMFVSQPLGGILTTPPFMAGLTGFNIAPVPEPSTIALGILGASSLLFLRRKK